jgi:hypothetical protein
MNPMSNPLSFGRRRVEMILDVFWLLLWVLGGKRHFLVALELVSKLLNLACCIRLTSPKLYYHLWNLINIVSAIRPTCWTCLTSLALCWRINSPMPLGNLSVQHFYKHVRIGSWSLSWCAVSRKKIASRRLRKSLILGAHNFWNSRSTTIRSFCLKQDMLVRIAMNLDDRLAHLHLEDDVLKLIYLVVFLLRNLFFLEKTFF